MKRLKLISFILSLLLCSQLKAQEDSLLNAVGYYEVIKNPSLKDTQVVRNIALIINDEVYVDAKKAHLHAYAIYDLSKKLNYVRGIADGLYYIAETKVHLGQIDAGLDFADKAITYSNSNGYKKGELNGYMAKGNGYYYKVQYDLATEQYFKGAEIAEAYFEEDLGGCYGAIGNMFRASGQNEKSKTYLEKGLKIARIYKDTSDLGFILNNLGIVTKNLGNLEEALVYYDEGLEIAVITGNLRREGDLVYNMANVHFRLGNNERGFELLERSSEVTAIIGTERDVALEKYNIGYWHSEFKEYKKAITYSLEAIALAEKTEYLDVLEASSYVLAESYAGIGDYKNAFEYKKKSEFYADSIKRITDKNVMLAIENEFETEKRIYQDSLQNEKTQLEIAHKEKLASHRIKSREVLLWIAVGVIILVFIGLFQMIRNNKKVKQKNKIITEQKEEIEEVHKEITDSINYAQKIQNALISGQEEWDKISKDHFMLFMPKDVVSGDFYWAYHSDQDNKAIWVTADCTGHGVPGAFMSMLGIGFLNEIVVENGNRNGSDILNQLRSKIVKALEQKGSDQQQKDGMDLSLCIWDKNSNVLEFTGANNGLYIIRKTEEVDQNEFEKTLSNTTNGLTLFELKANKMPVGFQSDEQKAFQSKTISLQKGDFLISFTDGYADQFGGKKGKKLKYKPFKEMLLEIQNEAVVKQSEILVSKFQDWKGSLEQVDDVCVIGVRV